VAAVDRFAQAGAGSSRSLRLRQVGRTRLVGIAERPDDRGPARVDRDRRDEDDEEPDRGDQEPRELLRVELLLARDDDRERHETDPGEDDPDTDPRDRAVHEMPGSGEIAGVVEINEVAGTSGRGGSGVFRFDGLGSLCRTPPYR
jgi:hypothetical protein